MPTTRVACAAVLTTPYGPCCAYCATLPTVLTLIQCAPVRLCSIAVCFVVCQAEVVAGKGQEPVETQIGDMVTHGNTW